MKGYKTDCSVLFFPFFRLLGGVLVRALEEKILSEGRVLEGGVLQVGAFLNQLVDTAFTREMADDIASAFAGDGVTKVLTVETSGIMIAFATAAALEVPMVFAKKNKTSNLDGNLLTAEIHSFTHNNTYTAAVCADYIRPDDKILIVDDFLANGEALRGLIALVRSGRPDRKRIPARRRQAPGVWRKSVFTGHHRRNVSRRRDRIPPSVTDPISECNYIT